MSTISEYLGDLNESATIEGVEAALASGQDPVVVLHALQAGMNVVGERFESGEYFLSELIYSADIFKRRVLLFKHGWPGKSRRPTELWFSVRSRTTSTTSARTLSLP